MMMSLLFHSSHTILRFTFMSFAMHRCPTLFFPSRIGIILMQFKQFFSIVVFFYGSLRSK